MMNSVYLLLGSNIGNRMEFLEKALYLIQARIGEVHAQSSVYETEPWGFKAERAFLNQAVLVETTMNPEELLSEIHEIEEGMGRSRREKEAGYLSREIDIDIIFFNDIIRDTEMLKIPHPRMHERRFTLEPVQELNAGHMHPVLKKTVAELNLECQDTLRVSRYQA
jgi:2-amino-4-hydroxy-6-hydroxymethyldihydropteridine diphosphokinase